MIKNQLGPMPQMDIITYRSIFTDTTSIGEIFLPHLKKRFCWSLEDAVRAKGLKITGKTAIFDNVRFKVGIHYSPRFKREMLILYTEKDNITMKIIFNFKEIKFTYIYSHGGNDHKDTDGCPLVAFNKISNKIIQGTAEKELFNIVAPWIRKGYDVGWTFINNF